MGQLTSRLGESRTRPPRRVIPTILGGFFGGTAQSELVATHFHVSADPETTWNRISLYEEVTGRPPLLLRVFMPHPLRTEGGKMRAGDLVHCIYNGGDLVKRIITVEPPYRMVFDVLQQRLGIEGCVIAQEGSYEVDRMPDGSDVILTTQYRTFLHPRWLWQPLERMVARSMHLHILRGMERSVREKASSAAV
jgi:hypothetical protein